MGISVFIISPLKKQEKKKNRSCGLQKTCLLKGILPYHKCNKKSFHFDSDLLNHAEIFDNLLKMGFIPEG